MQKDYKPYISGEFTRLGLDGAAHTIRDIVSQRLALYNEGRDQEPADAAMDIVGAILVPEHLENLAYDSKIQLLSMLRTHLDMVEGSKALTPENPLPLDHEVLDTFQRLAAATPFPARFIHFMDNKAEELAESLGKHPTLQKERLNDGDIIKLTHAFTHNYNQVFNLQPPLSATDLGNIRKPDTRLDIPQFLHALTLKYTERFFEGLHTGHFNTHLNMKADETPEQALRILLDPRSRAADGYYSRPMHDDVKPIHIAHKVAALTIQHMGLENEQTGFETWGLKEQPVTKPRGTAQAPQPARR